MKFHFPEGMRPATVEERQQFYRTEFDATILEQLMERWPRFTPVVDIGTESTLYRPRFKKYKGKLVRLTQFNTLQELTEKIVEYAPEDVYYRIVVEREDRIETNPERELVFDMDPERTACRKCERKRQYLSPEEQPYLFCLDCFTALARETRKLYAFLEHHFNELQLVYTGRGFHIHVMDDEAFKMDREDRRELASRAASEFPIDRAITAGEVDIVRLPGSLHGLVSRTVTVIDVDELEQPAELLHSRATPQFLDLQ